MSRTIRSNVRAAFEAEYRPASPGYRHQLSEIPQRGHPGSPSWALGLAAAAVACLVVVALLGVQHAVVPRSSPGATPPAAARAPAPDVLWVRPLSGQDAWVVAGGELWRTADGGGHWNRLTPPGASGGLVTVQAASRDQAWAAAGNHVYRTTDGGQHWVDGGPLNGAVRSLYFADKTHGWVLSSLGYTAGSEAVVIYRTGDGGQTWLEASRAPDAIPRACDKGTIGFDDESRGWIGGTCAGGPAPLFATRDGGMTWRLQPLPSPDGQGVLQGQYAVEPPVFFTDDDAVLAVSGALNGVLIYVTHNGGADWTLVTSVPAAARPAVMSMSDWMVLADGRIRVTHDAGATWSDLPRTLDTGSTVMAMITPSTGWAWQPNALYRTTDGARTWARVDLPNR